MPARKIKTLSLEDKLSNDVAAKSSQSFGAGSIVSHESM